MNKFAVVLLLSAISFGASAEKVYTCVGDRGEKFFSSTPCEPPTLMEQRMAEEIRHAREERIEGLKNSIAKVKRQIIDAESFYQMSLTNRTTEERAILKENYEEKVEKLKVELKDLEQRRTELVQQSFEDHLEDP